MDLRTDRHSSVTCLFGIVKETPCATEGRQMPISNVANFKK